ncbi:sphingolipid Delta4-desaturase [Dictyocaulus viviparus]|uniref:Sphingolipid Delta4-desaturase n=1 Tax=Dictyocaulus viviparus TaxID=29172 RepID=A0A0D8Y7R9_DICVI|nr:sphingolipid Delta4-desaturase [Dictyocaulus viviparus]
MNEISCRAINPKMFKHFHHPYRCHEGVAKWRRLQRFERRRRTICAFPQQIYNESTMGQSVSRDDFIWTYTEQPHMSRRKAIIKAHPEIKQLYGIDMSLKYVVLAMVLFQIFMCWLLQNEDWLLIFIEAYVSGGVINHAMTLAIHDISHNTAFGNRYPLRFLFIKLFRPIV